MLRNPRTIRWLMACKSQSHRAVAGLLSLAIGRETYPGFEKDLAASNAMALAEISQSHNIDTVLATAFENCGDIAKYVPEDLRIFFHEMQDANIRRNNILLDQLRQLGQSFAKKDVEVVALKGAAELLAPFSIQVGHRYISDIDILAAEDDLDIVVDILRTLGARQSPGEGDVPPDFHHLSPFVCDAWVAQVEVHRRLGNGATDDIISANYLLKNTVASPVAGVLLPSPTARLLHLVAHAQVSSGRHERAGFSLRDVLDFENMTTSSDGGSLPAAEARFASRGEGEAFDGFRALARSVFHSRSRRDESLAGDQWAARALASYGRPKLKRLLEAFWFFKIYLSDIRNASNRRAYRIKILKSPRALRRSFRNHRKRNRLIR